MTTIVALDTETDGLHPGRRAACCKLLGITQAGAHTALGDARDALAIYDRIIGGES